MRLVANFEHTDTFGGEANYAWVRKHAHTFHPDADTKAIAREARKWAGWEHVPCDVCDVQGTYIEIRPKDGLICEVVFVTFGD